MANLIPYTASYVFLHNIITLILPSNVERAGKRSILSRALRRANLADDVWERRTRRIRSDVSAEVLSDLFHSTTISRSHA